MKNIILLVILLILVIAGIMYRINLNNASKSSKPVTAQKKSAIISHVVYEGKLPCADCDGIQTKLTLLTDEKNNPLNYTLEQLYLGKSKTSLIENGMWTIVRGASFDKNATIYQLTGTKEKNKSYYLKESDRLELLSTKIQKISSSKPLFLQKIQNTN